MKNKGFTVVESLVAITILVGAVMGAMLTVQAGLSSYSHSQQQIAAFYLAQEGFEQLQNIRAENKLNGVNWLTGITANASDPCYFGKACTVSPVEDDQAVNCAGGPGSCPLIRQDSATGFYGYDASWSPTLYTREIQLTSIGPDEVAVTVSITWAKGTDDQEFISTVNMFDWSGDSSTFYQTYVYPSPSTCPTIAYSGPDSGTKDLCTGSLILTTPGTYIINISDVYSVTVKGVAGGGGGGLADCDSGVCGAGGGGGGGATNMSGVSIPLSQGVDYTAVVGTAGAGQSNGGLTSFSNGASILMLLGGGDKGGNGDSGYDGGCDCFTGNSNGGGGLGGVAGIGGGVNGGKGGTWGVNFAAGVSVVGAAGGGGSSGQVGGDGGVGGNSSDQTGGTGGAGGPGCLGSSGQSQSGVGGAGDGLCGQGQVGFGGGGGGAGVVVGGEYFGGGGGGGATGGTGHRGIMIIQ